MWLRELMLLKPVNQMKISDHYCLKINFIFQPKAYHGCNFLMQNAMNFNNVKTVLRNENFWYISKDKAINVMEKVNLKEKSQYL